MDKLQTIISKASDQQLKLSLIALTYMGFTTPLISELLLEISVMIVDEKQNRRKMLNPINDCTTCDKGLFD